MNKQKIGLGVLAVILIGGTAYLASTGKLGGLRSDVLSGSCSIASQQTNLEAYNTAINTRDRAQKTIELMNSQIALSTTTIETQKNTILEKQNQITAKSALLKRLSNYTYCARKSAFCTQLKKRAQNTQDEITQLQNDISQLNTSNNALTSDIGQKQGNIPNLQQKITDSTQYITQYDTCTTSIKNMPILKTALVDGETLTTVVAGEPKIANEVQMITGATAVLGSGINIINTVQMSIPAGLSATIKTVEWDVISNSTPSIQSFETIFGENHIPCTFAYSTLGNGPLHVTCQFDSVTENLRTFSGSTTIDLKLGVKLYNITNALPIRSKVSNIVYNSSNLYKDETVVRKIIGAQSAICGNGILDTGEQCDDGNTNNNDGCNNTCQTTSDSGVPPISSTR